MVELSSVALWLLVSLYILITGFVYFITFRMFKDKLRSDIGWFNVWIFAIPFIGVVILPFIGTRYLHSYLRG